MKRKLNLTIDLKTQVYNAIKLKQLDTTELIFKILDDAVQINLTSLSARIIFTKPNQQVVIQSSDIEINENILKVVLLEDCLRLHGNAKIEVELRKNEEVISSFFIPVQIEKTSKDNMQSDNTKNYIEELEDAIVLEKERQQDEKIRQENELTRQKLEEERKSNEDIRVLSELTREEAENTRNDSETIRNKAESERIFNEENRQVREVERKENEQSRQQKWQEIQDIYEQQSQDAGLEVAEARGTFEKLKNRLDDSDSKLENKVNTDDMSKAHVGTNITANTVEGYATLHKIAGRRRCCVRR